MGLCKTVDGRLEKHVFLESIQLDVVESFRNLGDEICPRCGCELATIARTRATCWKFRELRPLLTSTTISLARRGKLYDTCVKGTLLPTSECWPLRREEVQRFLRKVRAVLSWILKIKAKDNVRLSTMYGRLSVAPLVESKLRFNLLRCYGHLERSDKWINKCTHLEKNGFKDKGRSCKTWSATSTEDLKAWNFDTNNVHD